MIRPEEQRIFFRRWKAPSANKKIQSRSVNFLAASRPLSFSLFHLSLHLSLNLFLLFFSLFLSLSLSLFLSHRKNFYDVLSVPRGANDGQIKRAYRKLALKYHPDKVTGSEQQKAAAARRFAEINAAYEALGSEETRRVYDRFGEEGLKQHQAQNAQGGGGGGGGGPGGPMGGIFQQ